MPRVRLTLASLVTVAGCATHGSSGPDPDPCGDVGCASFPGTLTLTVLDAITQQPVKGTVAFTSNAQPMPFTCSIANPGPTCPSWLLSYEGAFDLEVADAGYRTNTIHVLIEGPAGCCGFGPDTSASLSLAPL